MIWSLKVPLVRVLALISHKIELSWIGECSKAGVGTCDVQHAARVLHACKMHARAQSVEVRTFEPKYLKN